MKQWKEYIRWKPDDAPNSTEAIVMVSEYGDIKRLPYKKWCKVNNNYSYMKEKTYSVSSNRGKQRHEVDRDSKYGKYLHVCINKKVLSVHRIVAECFVPNPNNLPQVNHIDENRSNNHFSNLEWVTNEQNQNKKSVELRKNTAAKLFRFSDDDCSCALKLRLSGIPIAEIGAMYNLSHETIRVRTDAIASPEQIAQIKKIQRENSERKRLETMRSRGMIK